MGHGGHGGQKRNFPRKQEKMSFTVLGAGLIINLEKKSEQADSAPQGANLTCSGNSKHCKWLAIYENQKN